MLQQLAKDQKVLQLCNWEDKRNRYSTLHENSLSHSSSDSDMNQDMQHAGCPEVIGASAIVAQIPTMNIEIPSKPQPVVEPLLRKSVQGETWNNKSCRIPVTAWFMLLKLQARSFAFDRPKS